jgi:general secretion pathway protein I
MKTLARGFTLLEVMIAVGVIGIAMLALLSLHHSNLQSVMRGQQLSRSAMLAQGLMTDAELERFPLPGRTHGNFEKMFPGVYPNYRWEREVAASPMFPDIRKVQITIFYGSRFSNAFSVVEFLHNPEPPEVPGQLQPGQPLGKEGAPLGLRSGFQ